MNLRKLRINKGLRQTDIAKYLGVERTTYVKYETGSSRPSLIDVTKLATFYNVSIDYLLGVSNNPSPIPSLTQQTPQQTGFDANPDLAEELRSLDSDERDEILRIAKLMNRKRRERQNRDDIL